MKILINFYAAVNEGTTNNFINFLTQQVHSASQKKQTIDEIIIQISSSGGSSDHGLLVYNYLKQLNIPKTTIGMGNVDSAAVMIYSAGEQRLAMPSCRFLLHEALTTVQGTFNGTKLHELANLNERITKDYCKVISSVTKQNLKAVEKKVKSGQVMSSEDAIKYKLTQKIQNNPYLKTIEGLNTLTINNPQKNTIPFPNKQNKINA